MAVQVLFTSHELVTVKVTLLVPPHLSGAPVLLLLKTGLHPPVREAVFSHALNLAFTVSCVKQIGSVLLVGQVKTTAGALVTVKVAIQETGGSQSLVTVKVTVVVPPHARGAPVLLLVSTGLQPPEKLTVANQAANLVFI